MESKHNRVTLQEDFNIDNLTNFIMFLLQLSDLSGIPADNVDFAKVKYKKRLSINYVI